jgi:ERCC4-related helicase
MLPISATQPATDTTALREEVPGVLLDSKSVQDLLDLDRRRWVSSVSDFRLKNYAEFLGRLRSMSVLVTPLSIRVYLFAHQLATSERVLKWMGCRALLADEVGLGKTIESGMIMKELLLRGLIRRVLILVPSGLTTQWREEMRHRFNEHFVIYDTDRRAALEERFPMKNIWEVNDRVIASLNVAKMKHHRELIEEVQWDLVIVDEAHRLKNTATLNYKLAGALKTRNLLLLTATPLQNNLSELYTLVTLLDEELLGSRTGFKRRFEDNLADPEVLHKLRKRLKRVMIRNRRADVGGILTASRRQAFTVQVTLDDANRFLYDQVTDYALQGYRLSVATKNSTYAFFMMLVQRMLTSSVDALTQTLEQRISILQNLKRSQDRLRIKDFLREQLEDRDLDDEALEEENLDHKHIEKEISELRRLVTAARNVKTHPKLTTLRGVLDEIFCKEPEARVVVFTEFRSTQTFLQEHLREWGYDVVIFHGGMNAREKDHAIESFEEEAQVLVSTEAGGEGRNLQFAHIVINYDLPWNPMKVEQRIGRVHRIGQSRDVQILNFSTAGTIEEYLLNLLENKIGLFREVLGDLETILGLIAEESSFEQMVMQLLADSYNKGNISHAFSELESRIDRARKDAGGSLLTTISSKGMDLSLKEDFKRYQDYRAGEDETHLQRFLTEFLDKYNALTDFSSDQFTFKVPGHLAHREVYTDIIRATGSREIALQKPYLEFVGVGHPFIDAAIRDCRSRLPLTVGIIRREALLDEGIVTRRSHAVITSFLVHFKIGSRREDRFFMGFASDDSVVVFDRIVESFLYLQEAPPLPTPSEQFQVLLERTLRQLVAQLKDEQHHLFEAQNQDLDEIRQYIRDYYRDLEYDIESQISRIMMDMEQLKRRRQKTEWAEEEQIAKREKQRQMERKSLMIEMMKLTARKKEKLDQAAQDAGVQIAVRLVSVAKVQIL